MSPPAARLFKPKGGGKNKSVPFSHASQGESIEEAISNLQEATELYLEEFPAKQTFRPILTTFEVGAHA